MAETLWKLELWGGTKLKVRKGNLDSQLSGVGWISLAEYPTRAEATDGMLLARAMIDAGESEDAIMVAFGQ